MSSSITPSNIEVSLGDEEFIVSKTDSSGRILYTNRVFMQISGYSEAELLGQPHNMIRHPDMPRGVFKLLWDTIKAGDEFFGYVKNLCRDGSHYWVYANITCDYEDDGSLRGYYSVRRKPPTQAIDTISQLYQQMLQLEQQASSSAAADTSVKFLHKHLAGLGLDYNSFVQNLYAD